MLSRCVSLVLLPVLLALGSACAGEGDGPPADSPETHTMPTTPTDDGEVAEAVVTYSCESTPTQDCYCPNLGELKGTQSCVPNSG